MATTHYLASFPVPKRRSLVSAICMCAPKVSQLQYITACISLQGLYKTDPPSQETMAVNFSMFCHGNGVCTCSCPRLSRYIWNCNVSCAPHTSYPILVCSGTLSIMDTIGDRLIVGCPKLRGFQYISGRHGIRILLSTTWLCFPSFPLLYPGR